MEKPSVLIKFQKALEHLMILQNKIHLGTMFYTSFEKLNYQRTVTWHVNGPLSDVNVWITLNWCLDHIELGAYHLWTQELKTGQCSRQDYKHYKVECPFSYISLIIALIMVPIKVQRPIHCKNYYIWHIYYLFITLHPKGNDMLHFFIKLQIIDFFYIFSSVKILCL